MATEHVEEYGRGEKMDRRWETNRGWGSSSPSRFYPTCSWRPWGDTSTRDAASSEDAWGKVSQPAESPRDGWGEASQSAGNGWGEASQSAGDAWGEASQSAGHGWGQASQSPVDVLYQAPEARGDDGWGRAAESPRSSWCDLDDPYGEFEEPREADIVRKCSGLTNLGNTCFMNAVLQCLTYTVPFANRIVNNQHKFLCPTQGFCVMCALQDHMKVVLSASGQTVSPAYLAHNLSQISRSFALGQQQDAHEFLLYLMDGMQKCCKSDSSCTTQAGDASFVSEIFIGKMKSQVKCKSCAHCSDSVEPFLGLNLEIENCDSIKEALSNFLAVEELEEENKISCSHCKEVVSRSKQLSFSRSPQALVIQLKRYKATEIFPTKIERDIKYEMSLDLMPFISKGDDSVLVQECDWKYRLYAVLVHSGWSTASGHYYCYVQTSPGIWHCMNDSLVSRVNEWTVLNQEAYILFYIREGINEELHLENTLPAEPDIKVSESPLFQKSEKVDSPVEAGPVCDKPSLLLHNEVEDPVIPSQAVLTERYESSSQVPMEIEVEVPIVCSQVKSPCVSRQSQSDTRTSVPAQQAPKQCILSPKVGNLHELEEPKPSPCIKGQSSLKAEKTSSPSLCSGGTQVVLDSFENGSQHSFLRLLNKMPSTRRQALLASALSGQEAMKQSSPTAKIVKDKSKLNATKQMQCGRTRGTSSFLHDAEQDIKEGLRSREKPWTEEYDHIDSRKMQRVGGKRVMASFSSGVHHQIHGVAKANIV